MLGDLASFCVPGQPFRLLQLVCRHRLAVQMEVVGKVVGVRMDVAGVQMEVVDVP